MQDMAGYGGVNIAMAWLPRIIALEILCVLLFGQWYLARYYLIGIHLPIMVVLGLSLFFVVGSFLVAGFGIVGGPKKLALDLSNREFIIQIIEFWD